MDPFDPYDHQPEPDTNGGLHVTPYQAPKTTHFSENRSSSKQHSVRLSKVPSRSYNNNRYVPPSGRIIEHTTEFDFRTSPEKPQLLAKKRKLTIRQQYSNQFDTSSTSSSSSSMYKNPTRRSERSSTRANTRAIDINNDRRTIKGKGATIDMAIEVLDSDDEEKLETNAAIERYNKTDRKNLIEVLSGITDISINDSIFESKEYKIHLSVIRNSKIHLSISTKDNNDDIIINDCFDINDINNIYVNYIFKNNNRYFIVIELSNIIKGKPIYEFLQNNTNTNNNNTNTNNNNNNNIIIYYDDVVKFKSGFHQSLVTMLSTNKCKLIAKIEELKLYDPEFYYSTLYEQQNKKTKKKSDIYCIYPLKDSAVSPSVINKNDLSRLEPLEFLNDSLINFYLRYIRKEYLDYDQSKYFFFNSFFYTRMHSLPESERYDHVRNWTQGINIFERDFLIVPLNERLHWTVAIICYPGRINKDNNDEDNDDNVVINDFSDSSDDEVLKKQSLCTNLINKFTNRSSSKLASKYYSNNRHNRQNNINILNHNSPCILYFDSLYNTSRSKEHIFKILDSFLEYEWNIKYKYTPQKYQKFHLPVIDVPCTKQDNGSDCGIYLLKFVEEFIKNPPEDVKIYNALLDRSIFKQGRNNYLQLLEKLHDKYIVKLTENPIVNDDDKDEKKKEENDDNNDDYNDIELSQEEDEDIVNATTTETESDHSNQ